MAKKVPRIPLVAYVPRLDYPNLRRVIKEDEKVGEFTVVFLCFEWSHDLPASVKPEFEPIAVVYKDSPKYVFWRPHRGRKWRKVDRRQMWSSPIREGNKVVVFVSYFGHAFRVSRRSILLPMVFEALITGAAVFLSLLLTLPMPWQYLAILAMFGALLWFSFGWQTAYKKVGDHLYVDGKIPEEADVYEGVSFRQFVKDVLRPENNKNNQSNNPTGRRTLILVLPLIAIMPKTMVRLFLAGRSFSKGDLDDAHRHLMKAYLALPTRFKQTHFGDWLLDNIEGLGKIIEDRTPLTREDLNYMKKKFMLAPLVEAPNIIIAAIKPSLIDENQRPS